MAMHYDDQADYMRRILQEKRRRAKEEAEKNKHKERMESLKRILQESAPNEGPLKKQPSITIEDY